MNVGGDFLEYRKKHTQKNQNEKLTNNVDMTNRTRILTPNRDREKEKGERKRERKKDHERGMEGCG